VICLFMYSIENHVIWILSQKWMSFFNTASMRLQNLLIRIPDEIQFIEFGARIWKFDYIEIFCYLVFILYLIFGKENLIYWYSSKTSISSMYMLFADGSLYESILKIGAIVGNEKKIRISTYKITAKRLMVFIIECHLRNICSNKFNF